MTAFAAAGVGPACSSTSDVQQPRLPTMVLCELRPTAAEGVSDAQAFILYTLYFIQAAGGVLDAQAILRAPCCHLLALHWVGGSMMGQGLYKV